MTRFKFSTVKFIPNLVRNEPVNIGILFFDLKENKRYARFTNNWKEVSYRSGTKVDLSNLVQDYDMIIEDDVIPASHNQYLGNLTITPPKQISLVKNIQNTLKVLFAIQISVPQLKQSTISK